MTPISFTSQLLSYAEDFYNLCIIKNAFIRKLPNGKWRVVSRKGRNLGTYDTKEKAQVRLKQIEFFKHKKATKDEEQDHNHEITYSSMMRFLNHHSTPENVENFQKTFKKEFDRLYLEGTENPEEQALEFTLEHFQPIKKEASGEQELGNPDAVGKYIAGLIGFLGRKIPNKNKPKAFQSIKQKIYYINEYDLSSKMKKGGFGSTIGQAINVTKNLMMGKEPAYIRLVINSIIKNL